MANQNTDTREKLYEEYEDSLFRLVMHSASEKEGKLLLEEKAVLLNDAASKPSAEAVKKFEQRMASYRKKKMSRKRGMPFTA